MLSFKNSLIAGVAAIVVTIAPLTYAKNNQELPASSLQAANMPSFADLVEDVMPAVVNISTTQVIEGRSGSPELDLFEEFFGERFNLPQQEQGPREAQALGSGFIISADGYIVTNNHVIEGADEITVITQDAKEMKAKLIGADPQTDIAVLKVEGSKLPYVNFGDSNNNRVGDWVIAIGNPFGFGGTVTKGIISARGRNIGSGPYDDYIQTDAPINRGNSGGPLFNLKGEVIGVNTAIISPTGGSIGIGFAVPTSTVEDIVKQLKENGSVKRAWLGVQIQEVDEALASSLGLKETKGALVADLIEGPAEAAGILQGDVIIKVNDIEVADSRELTRLVAASPVDEIAVITVIRDGKEKDIKVKLAERKDNITAKTSSTSKDDSEALLDSTGLTIQELTDEARNRYGIARNIEGVLVTKVKPLSASSKAGIIPGTVILEMNKVAVKSPADAAEQYLIAKESGKDSVLTLVHQSGSGRYLALPITKDEDKETKEDKTKE